jgi:hypothetical protein
MGRLCCIGEPKAHFVIVLTRSNSVDSAKFAAVDEFRYDAGRDAYICPAGQTLKPFRHGRLRDLKKIDYGNPKACRDCPLRARCTNDVRSISRIENEDALGHMGSAWRRGPTFSTAVARSSSTPSFASGDDAPQLPRVFTRSV